MSELTCGCDADAGWMCEQHRGERIMAHLHLVVDPLRQQVATLTDARDEARRTVTSLRQQCDAQQRDQATLLALVATLTGALRKLMKESAAVIALAEPVLRDEIGHTNVAVFQQRIGEASVALAAARGER